MIYTHTINLDANTELSNMAQGDTFAVDNLIACPHCKVKLNMYMPTLNSKVRKVLSKCTKCYKDIVIDIKVKECSVKYDVKIKKVV